MCNHKMANYHNWYWLMLQKVFQLSIQIIKFTVNFDTLTLKFPIHDNETKFDCEQNEWKEKKRDRIWEAPPLLCIIWIENLVAEISLTRICEHSHNEWDNAFVRASSSYSIDLLGWMH